MSGRGEPVGGKGFPATRTSMVAGLTGDDDDHRQRAFSHLVEAYWRPVYKYARVRWRKHDEEARDITQAFFTAAIEKRFFRSYDPARAPFRVYLRLCLERFIINDVVAQRRLKRGGGAVFAVLDFEQADRELGRAGPPEASAVEALFDQEFARTLSRLAVAALRRELAAKGKDKHLLLFERYDLADDDKARPSYADLAAELGLQVTDVTNYLAFARRELRRLVLEELRKITCSEEEFRSEARAMLGIDPGAEGP